MLNKKITIFFTLLAPKLNLDIYFLQVSLQNSLQSADIESRELTTKTSILMQLEIHLKNSY